jgi:hypothetical protein
MKTYEKIQLTHRVQQWKLGTSMKNMKKKFGIFKKKKNLESLETKD